MSYRELVNQELHHIINAATANKDQTVCFEASELGGGFKIVVKTEGTTCDSVYSCEQNTKLLRHTQVKKKQGYCVSKRWLLASGFWSDSYGRGLS